MVREIPSRPTWSPTGPSMRCKATKLRTSQAASTSSYPASMPATSSQVSSAWVLNSRRSIKPTFSEITMLEMIYRPSKTPRLLSLTGPASMRLARAISALILKAATFPITEIPSSQWAPCLAEQTTRLTSTSVTIPLRCSITRRPAQLPSMELIGITSYLSKLINLTTPRPAKSISTACSTPLPSQTRKRASSTEWTPLPSEPSSAPMTWPTLMATLMKWPSGSARLRKPKSSTSVTTESPISMSSWKISKSTVSLPNSEKLSLAIKSDFFGMPQRTPP